MRDQVCLANSPLGKFCSDFSLCDMLSVTLLLVNMASEVDQLLDLCGCYLWTPVVNSHCRRCGYLLGVYTLILLLLMLTLFQKHIQK